MKNKLGGSALCSCNKGVEIKACCKLDDEQISSVHDNVKKLMQVLGNQANISEADIEQLKGVLNETSEKLTTTEKTTNSMPVTSNTEKPKPSILGLSDIQANTLLEQPFSKDSVLRFNLDIKVRDTDAPILYLSKKLLKELSGKTTPASDRGLLPKPLVNILKEFYQRNFTDLTLADKTNSGCEFALLQICRYVLTQGGWMRKFKGEFMLTKKGELKRQKLKGGQNNALFLVELMQVYCTKIDWATESEFENLPTVQRSFGYILLMLFNQGNKEQDVNNIVEQFIDYFPNALHDYSGEPELAQFEFQCALVERFFMRFAWRFGLILQPKLSTDNVSIKTSSLFSKWLTFK